MQGKQATQEILGALQGVSKIRQVLIVLKFQVLDIDGEEIEQIIHSQQIDPMFATKSVVKKLQFLVEDLNNFDFGIDLPWLCRLTKAEIELNGEVRFMLGFILDNSNQKITTTQIIDSLHSKVNTFLNRKVIDPFVQWKIIDINQILDHISVKGIQGILTL